MGHIQVDIYSEKLHLNLKLRRDARATLLGVISITELWHLHLQKGRDT